MARLKAECQAFSIWPAGRTGSEGLECRRRHSIQRAVANDTLSVRSTTRFRWRALPIMVVMVVVMVVVMIVVPVVASAVVIPVVAAVPVMIVLHAAVFSFPITRVVSFAVMALANPASSLVWWSSPIASMPPVMVSYGIPITLDPNELRTWSFRHSYNNPGRRWRSNDDSNGNLCSHCRGRRQQQRGEQYGFH
jgi:hypothetical protein